MSDVILQVSNLEKQFRVGQGKILRAVDNVSFTIQRGKTLGLVGESGCGKTTLGRTILQLYTPTSGRIEYGGETIFEGQDPWPAGENGEKQHVKVPKCRQVNMLPYRRKMQIIFQDPSASLDPRMTVGEIIGEALDIHKLCSSKAERTDRIKELLGMVGLNTEHANRYPHEFSGGQQQRVGIARAFVSKPRVIFADEPTGNLDSITSKQVLYRMLQISKQMGTTFVMVTHEPELASCADRIITILDGKVQSDVVQDPATRERNREALFASLEGNMRIGGDSASGEVHQKTAAELASYAAPAAAAQQPEQPKP